MNLAERDLKHIWHPCSQMKDYEAFPPLEVVGAAGSYIHLANGKPLIDAISSWWCKSLGHGHPRLRSALISQAEKFEHVIAANLCHEPIVCLSERLAALTTKLSHVMYASDGSSAVEIAIKMALHAQHLQGRVGRNQFACLQNSYHGETGMAMSVSDLGLYRKPYESMLTKPIVLENIPYVNSESDELWQNCESKWRKIECQLEENIHNIAGIIVEPMLQGAGGMKVYSQDFLRRLRCWTKRNDVYLIADEIMTSFGRTGYALACEHAGIEADFVCLGKSLTAGWLPMSAVLILDDVYQLFYQDYQSGKSFLHSHTFSGNPLAAAVALETLNILEEEKIYKTVRANSTYLLESMQSVANDCEILHNVRNLGFMVAADLRSDHPRAGYAVYKEAVSLGALLRPLGNTLYWTPPLNIENKTVDELREITILAIQNCRQLL